ncbi:MAG: glycosyltransferase [Planctomycetes bacterium]|nr:glycosyltransferase [Planctomycetota bacterium]
MTIPARSAWHLPDYSSANPYQRLLAEALERRGLRVHLRDSFPAPEEWRAPGAPRLLHLHWVHPFFLAPPGASRPRWLAGWAKRLAQARAEGLRLVWTVHQVEDHEGRDPAFDRFGVRVTAWAAHRCIVHNQASAEALRRITGRWRGVVVIPHGHYGGAYPAGRTRAEVRAEWGVTDREFVVLFIGSIRPYKGIERLLSSFREWRRSGVRLVIAGRPQDEALRRSIEVAASSDSRILFRPGFVPDGRLREYLEASDLVALPFDEQVSSGSAILALSFGCPVMIPDLPTFREMRDWPGVNLFTPGSADSLRDGLERSASQVRAPAESIVAAVGRWDWDGIASATARCYTEGG